MGIKTTAIEIGMGVEREQVGTDQERMYWNSSVMWFIGTVKGREGR